MAAFPVGENRHRDGILETTVVPARVPERLAEEARALAIAVAERMAYVGVLGVELFVANGGRLFVNEMAPRPHNSGHYTMDACTVDQFEQQLRALCGLPLGEPRLLTPAAMINLLGDLWAHGEPRWAEALRLPGVRLHLYGKAEPEAGPEDGPPQLSRPRRRGRRSRWRSMRARRSWRPRLSPSEPPELSMSLLFTALTLTAILAPPLAPTAQAADTACQVLHPERRARRRAQEPARLAHLHGGQAAGQALLRAAFLARPHHARRRGRALWPAVAHRRQRAHDLLHAGGGDRGRHRGAGRVPTRCTRCLPRRSGRSSSTARPNSGARRATTRPRSRHRRSAAPR